MSSLELNLSKLTTHLWPDCSSAADKFEVITRNLDEVLGGDLLKQTLEQRDLVAYWGTAPTGRRESTPKL